MAMTLAERVSDALLTLFCIRPLSAGTMGYFFFYRWYMVLFFRRLVMPIHGFKLKNQRHANLSRKNTH